MATKPKREKGKRWGKKRIDNRDWKKTNEELVVRGEFLLELGWVKSWDKELKKMNEGKRGSPYEFPESLIRLQAVWNQWVSVRGVEGITRKLVEVAELPNYNDYSTINRRVRKIEPCFELPTSGSCCASSDGTGMRMHSAGEYRHIKYRGKQRRWLKIVITADPNTRDLLNVEASIDGEGDSEPEIAMQHLNLLYKAGIDVLKFFGDGSFDVHDLFNLLEQHSTDSAIPPRDDASNNAHGSMRRAREVADYKSKSWDEWAKAKEYGKRWLGTEGIFSSVKGIFGEDTRAKTPKTACLEAERKFWAYETIRRYAKAHI